MALTLVATTAMVSMRLNMIDIVTSNPAALWRSSHPVRLLSM
jgi:hypothetical protein